MNFHKNDADFNRQLRALRAEDIVYYFRERGSGNFRCSLCSALVWHSDAIGHAFWHAVSNHRATWPIQDAQEPEDMQYVVVIQYCNGRFKAPDHMMLGRAWIEECRGKNQD